MKKKNVRMIERKILSNFVVSAIEKRKRKNVMKIKKIVTTANVLQSIKKIKIVMKIKRKRMNISVNAIEKKKNILMKIILNGAKTLTKTQKSIDSKIYPFRYYFIKNYLA